jgi:hypothetical protein
MRGQPLPRRRRILAETQPQLSALLSLRVAAKRTRCESSSVDIHFRHCGRVRGEIVPAAIPWTLLDPSNGHQATFAEHLRIVHLALTASAANWTPRRWSKSVRSVCCDDRSTCVRNTVSRSTFPFSRTVLFAFKRSGRGADSYEDESGNRQFRRNIASSIKSGAEINRGPTQLDKWAVVEPASTSA